AFSPDGQRLAAGVINYVVKVWDAEEPKPEAMAAQARGEDRAARARTHARLFRWEKAIADYTRAIELMPDNASLWFERGRCYGHLGQWQKAAPDYTRAVELRPGDAELACEYAGVLVLAGDTEGYRRLCARLLDPSPLGRTTDPRVAYLVARSCVLAPAAVTDPQWPVRRAAQAVAAERAVPWYLHTVGLAHYRAGEFDEAVKRFQESEEANMRWDARVV